MFFSLDNKELEQCQYAAGRCRLNINDRWNQFVDVRHARVAKIPSYLRGLAYSPLTFADTAGTEASQISP